MILCGSPLAPLTSRKPSAPAPPDLLTTISGSFISLCLTTMPWIRRAIWSAPPPVPAGTTNSTGLVGSHAACAGRCEREHRRAERGCRIHCRGLQIWFSWRCLLYESSLASNRKSFRCRRLPTITAQWSCQVGTKPLDDDQVCGILIPFQGLSGGRAACGSDELRAGLRRMPELTTPGGHARRYSRAPAEAARDSAAQCAACMRSRPVCSSMVRASSLTSA